MSETLNDIIAEDAQERASETAQTVQAEAAQADESGEIADLIGAAAAVFFPAYPKLEAVYTPQTCAKLGKATAAIFTKYGWTLGGVFDRWGAEIAFAIVAIPVGMATARAVQDDGGESETPPPAPERFYKPLETVN